MVQTLCDNGLGGFSTLFLEQAGLFTVNYFGFIMPRFDLGAIGVFSSWVAMAQFNSEICISSVSSTLKSASSSSDRCIVTK
jgi:hypothetical protein